MNELLFFIIGLVIGGLVGIVLMCFVQIGRFNELEKEYLIATGEFQDGESCQEKN